MALPEAAVSSCSVTTAIALIETAPMPGRDVVEDEVALADAVATAGVQQRERQRREDGEQHRSVLHGLDRQRHEAADDQRDQVTGGAQRGPGGAVEQVRRLRAAALRALGRTVAQSRALDEHAALELAGSGESGDLLWARLAGRAGVGMSTRSDAVLSDRDRAILEPKTNLLSRVASDRA